jgi:hypothetical protein
MIAGNQAVARIGDRAGLLAETVPDRPAALLGIGSALDLKRTGRNAEHEVIRQLGEIRHQGFVPIHNGSIHSDRQLTINHAPRQP